MKVGIWVFWLVIRKVNCDVYNGGGIGVEVKGKVVVFVVNGGNVFGVWFLYLDVNLDCMLEGFRGG